MGSGKAYSLHEIDDTRDADADDKFEKILKRVISSGGEILDDETSPLYTEIGMQEFEVGEERIVKFSLARMDFLLSRKVETHRLTGTGRSKSVEPLDRRRINITLKRKPDSSDEWQVVDLEDMF